MDAEKTALAADVEFGVEMDKKDKQADYDGDSGLEENSLLRSQISQLKAENDQFKPQNAQLKAENDELKSEKDELLVQLQAELHSKETVEEKMKTLKTKMAEHLQCSVCLQVPRDAKIPVCVNGHITCGGCKEKTGDICPESRVDYQGSNAQSRHRGDQDYYSYDSDDEIRIDDHGKQRFSIIAGNISDLLELECCNEAKGCIEKLLRPDIVKHESICIYTENLNCPRSDLDCEAKVSYMNCIEHLNKFHNQKQTGIDKFIGTNYTMPFKKALPISGMGKWYYTCPIYRISGTDDHIIVGGKNIGDTVLISARCLSRDRSQRYYLQLLIADEKSKCRKMSFGQTMLMTEDWKTGLKAGNVLEMHSTTFEMFQRSGNMVLYWKVEKIEDDVTKDEDQKNEANQEADSKPSGSGIKRPLENIAGGESNKKQK